MKEQKMGSPGGHADAREKIEITHDKAVIWEEENFRN